MQCARPWKQQKTAPAEQETQVLNLSPVAKCLKDAFDEAAGSPQASVASASGIHSAVSADAKTEEDDLFDAEPQEFLTRESQFAAKLVPEEEEEEDDRKPKAKAKAKAKAKSKAKAVKAEASQGSGKKRGRPPKAKANPSRRDGDDEKKAEASEMDRKDEPEEMNDEEDGEPKEKRAIFARRYRPPFCVFAGKRWDAIKASFELHILGKVLCPGGAQVSRLP